MKFVISCEDSIYGVYNTEDFTTKQYTKSELLRAKDEIYGVTDSEITIYETVEKFVESYTVMQSIYGEYIPDWTVLPGSELPWTYGCEDIPDIVGLAYNASGFQTYVSQAAHDGVFRLPEYIGYFSLRFLGYIPLRVFDARHATATFDVDIFGGQMQLEEFYMPKTLIVSQSCCMGCHNLKKVVIQAWVGKDGIAKAEIDRLAFTRCYKLSDVQISEGFVSIGLQAFTDCRSLQNLALPSTMRAIGQQAFLGSGLTAFTAPEGLETLCSAAFKGCASLQKVVLNDKLATIEDGCFADTPVKAFVLPPNLKKIGEGAFPANAVLYVKKHSQTARLLRGSAARALFLPKLRKSRNIGKNRVIYQ